MSPNLRLVVLITTACRREPAPAAPDLKPPAVSTRIPVAFVVTRDAEVVDFGGPWGVFEYVFPPGYHDSVFRLDRPGPVRVSGGLQVVPDYTFANAPPPKIVVVPAQAEPSEAELAWLRATAPSTDVTLSVCNGAFVLGQAGLLDGKSATAHHGAYASLGAQFSRVVERYYGRDIAEATATALEYRGQGSVCEMAVNPKTAIHRIYRGHDYAFCSEADRDTFDRAPDPFVP